MDVPDVPLFIGTEPYKLRAAPSSIFTRAALIPEQTALSERAATLKKSFDHAQFLFRTDGRVTGIVKKWQAATSESSSILDTAGKPTSEPHHQALLAHVGG